ncbi:MAG: hypothetical protein NUK65_08265 [Firmicutes bacterium]|nr:hypothetical protein [Bacillota bacterium]
MINETQTKGIILLGFIGFVLLLFYDMASLKKVKNRFVLSILGYGIQAYAIIWAALRTEMRFVGEWVMWLGLPVALAGLSWLLYCLFLFPPIRKTYQDVNGPVLTTQGPYALCRHPGIYGYSAFVLGLALLTRSELLFVSGCIWSCINVGYVFLQDRFIFGSLLSGYQDYRNHTPMLIPNEASVKKFWKTK